MPLPTPEPLFRRDHFINRELSLLQFQRRVLAQAADALYSSILVWLLLGAGLLFTVAKTLTEHAANLHTAKIATLGERVEDVFFITDADNQPLADPELCSRLQQTIVGQLSEAQGGCEPQRIEF